MHDVDEYRRDVRDTQQFAKDIKEGTNVERIIIEKFVQILKRKTDGTMNFVIKNHGCGNSGEWLSPNRVSTKADFDINGNLIEVKFCRPFSEMFHFKVHQIQSCILQSASILFVNGYGTSSPKYTYLTKSELIEFSKKYKKVSYWEKETFEVPAKDLYWEDFI